MPFTFTMTPVDVELLMPEILMTGLLSLILCLDFLFPRIGKTTLAWLSIAGMGGIFLLLAGYFIDGRHGTLFHEMYVIDPMAIFFKAFILGTTILVFLASIDYLKKVPVFRGEYYFLGLLAALGMMLMVSANDLLSLFITLEFSTFSFYILVAYLRDDPKSNEAGLKFFILGVFAAGLLAFGISLIYGETGSIIFTDFARMHAHLTPGMVIGFLLIFVALGFKIGAVPFHAWVPDIYQGAPTPVTAFLSIAPKAATFAILLRIFTATLGDIRGDWVWLIVAISAVSMTYGNIVAISQKNIKRLLAYSGIAQIGNVLIGLAAASKMGDGAILFYLMTYLFANLGAFTVVIIFSNLTNSDDLEDYNGLSRRSPLLAGALLIFFLSLAGVPPLAGFIGKLYVFVAAMNEGLLALVVIGGINIVISMYYYLIVIKRVYIYMPKDNAPIPVSFPMRLVLITTVGGVLLLGIYPKAFIEISAAAAELFSRML
ncbi:MAG: NADH-quinone oxidoreductase subunit N [Nitrospirae bacterium]|nr:NADH-quinone oxidoreductase subunit N [Nitrospirota bacterium]